MSVEVTFKTTITNVETLENNVPAAAADKAVTHSGFNTSKTLNSASTPPATKGNAFELALSGGAATLDLTAIPATGGGTYSGSGLKVQLLRIRNKAANANSISIAVGASNGYELAGSDFKVTLAPGQEFTFYGNDATPDVAAGDKELDLAGTGTQAVEIDIVLG